MARSEREAAVLSLRRDLLAHLSARPAAGAEDVVKFVFQGMLGMGHLLAAPEQAEAYVAREEAQLAPAPDEPLTEPLGGRWCRLNLRRAMAEGLSPRDIAGLMLTSPDDGLFTRADVAAVCAEVTAGMACPGTEEILRRLADPGWLPSHSEAYRAAYSPAYRVIGADWLPLMPALLCTVRARAASPRALVTLDGPCASGKTTLAGRLAAALDAAVLHTDDFVVPHARKTPERLAQPGGNCDWERLTADVLAPWKAGGSPEVRRYDFRADALLPAEPLPERPVLILEGSYCNLPAIRALADVRLFMATDLRTRMARLERRESPASLAMFHRRWIPLEDAYFAAFGLPDEGCAVIG